MSASGFIHVAGARQHNLKNISVRIPRGKLTVITGLSGSGKSSLAFDTLHAEGRRRYVESLSVHARQFLEQLPPPDVDRIDGLSPTIAIEQRPTLPGPRSTVATVTEIYDFLRVLFARAAVALCWKCARPIVQHSISEIVDAVRSAPAGSRIMILAPRIYTPDGAGPNDLLDRVRREGFLRLRIDGEILALEEISPDRLTHRRTIEVVVDRLILKDDITTRLADSLETAARLGAGRIQIASQSAEADWNDAAFSTVPACPQHPEVRIDAPGPRLFSFNTVHGACPECHGLGIRLDFDPELVIPDRGRSLRRGAVAPWRGTGRRHARDAAEILEEFCRRFHVDESQPLREWPDDAVRILLHGATEADVARFNAPFEGLLSILRNRWQASESESARRRLYEFLAETPCEECHGSRLRREARAYRLAGKAIAEITALTIDRADEFFARLSLDDHAAVAAPLIQAIRSRLQFLMECGVAYLTLHRPAASLSGGEWQRIRLATQIGGGLSGVCYVLDEPTIGLHPADGDRLAAILRRLAELDNTVIVVEHDARIIETADHLIEIGPGAGALGGEVVAEGSLNDVRNAGRGLTVEYLTGKRSNPVPDSRRKPDATRTLALTGVSANNLRNIDVKIPLGLFVCVTGVSGSGKSTLVHDVLVRGLRRILNSAAPPACVRRIDGAEPIREIIEVDQSPIGRTPRSNPATFVGAFSWIRELFALTREAKIRGYGPQRFSFNVRGGRCEHCEGQGTRRIALHFLPDVFVPCGHCAGRRYNRETLAVRYRGKSIADVLEMSVDDAVTFFENMPRIHSRVAALRDVGLGYLSLGQASNTLSGGEAQRVKLAARLHRGGDGSTLFVLDEPTAGLHFADVGNLLAILHRLVDQGNSLIVIEHNLDVIRAADWIIDLGPGAGDAGGRIVASGPPESVARSDAGLTARFLRAALSI